MKKIFNHPAILWLLLLLLPLSGLRAQYQGGIADGHAQDSLRITTCGFSAQFFAYFGGISDGSDVQTKTYTTCPAPPQFYAYIGGSGDGNSFDSLRLSTCAQPPQFYAYQGGVADGNALDSLRNTTCATPAQFYAYFGGRADGFAIDTTRQCPSQAPVTAFTVSSATLCAGDTVQFIDTSANSPFVYKWYFTGGTVVTSDTVARPVVRYNTAGVYTVKLVARNFIGSDSLTKISYITVNANPVVNLGNDTIVCMPNMVTLNAGNAGATYQWSTGAATQTVSVNSTGLYSVRVTRNGCNRSDTISVIANPVPVVALGNDTAICAGHTVTLNAGNTGASYIWNTGSNTQSISVSTTNNYYVAVTKNGCTGRDSIMVTVNLLPVVNLSNDTSICTPATVLLNAGNTGATYAWSTLATTQTISTGTSGSYTVTVTLPTGCSAADTKVITAIQSPLVNLGNDTTFCAGGSAVLNASYSGATYSWSTLSTQPMITVTATGTYAVTVTTGGLCTATDSKVATVIPLPVVNLGNDTSICSGSVVLNAGNAGATYLWSTAAATQTITVSTSGNYSVTVTRNGCSASDSKVVTVNSNPLVSLGNDTAVCAGNSIVLNAGNAGATYLWSTGATSQTITVSTAGTYSVIATLTGGCTARDTVVVSITPLPVVNLGNDTSICNGSVILNAGNAGATYLWSTTATTQTITVSTSGNYSVTVTRNGCSASDSKVVTVNSNPVVSLGNDTAICSGNSVVLNAANAGATYLWSTGATSQSINVSTAGTYSIAATLTGGCTARDTITVSITPLPIVNLGNDTSICNGSVVLNAGNAGATYLWSTAAATQTITVNTSGNYSVTVMRNGCAASDSKVVTVNSNPLVILGNDTAVCAGNSIVLNAGNAGATYLWSTGATTQTITVSTAGTYSVTTTLAGGCAARDTIVVSVTPLPVVNLGNDTSICAGNLVTINAGNAGATYIWSTNAITQTISVSTSGTYSATVTRNGCSASDSKVITVNPLPVVQLGNDTTLCAGYIVLLNAGNAGSTYAWSNGGTNQSTTVTMSGIYSVIVTNANLCSSRDTISVTVIPVAQSGFAATICPGTTYTFHSSTLIQAGIYKDTLSSSAGCDSIVTLTLSLYAPSVYSTMAYICPGDSFNFRGSYIHQAGMYADTLSGAGAHGCDSIIQLVISIRPVTVHTTIDTICYGHTVTFDGNILNLSGTYRDTLTSSAGCDSISILQLTIAPQIGYSYSTYTCQGHAYNFNGRQLTAAGSYTDTLTSVRGCDSIVNLTLAIRTATTVNIADTICEGDRYIFHSRQLTQSGNYSDTLAAINGCDSIVILELTANSKPNPVITLTGRDSLSTAPYSSYQWLHNGIAITGATSQQYVAIQNGSYSIIVSNSFGCSDTSATISLTQVGIKEISQSLYHVYPNPTEDLLYIDAKDLPGNTTLSLVNSLGQVLYQDDINTNDLNHIIDMKSFASGVYMLMWKASGSICLVQKIIKK